MNSPPPPKPGTFTRQGLLSEFRETIKTLVFAVLFAFVFRSFVYEPFHIPSDSMKSNLLVGDYLFVSKFSYGYSRYSFPFFGWPEVHGRFLRSDPKRGDVVVFRPPGKPSEDFIKRLIGLPGDHIQMRGGVLYINDKPALKEYVDEWTDPSPDGRSGKPVTYMRYRETLPEGKTYYILNNKNYGAAEDTDVFVVPEGHYFMMGDNRDDSRDSRYLAMGDGVVGYVPEENFVGRADIIMFSWESLFSLRSERFFKIIP
jgi:signal peptidase I